MSRTFTPEGSPVPNGAAAPDPVPSRPPTDQERFDATVNRDSKIVLQILAGVAIFAALVMSTVALVLSGGKNAGTTTVTQPAIAAAPAPVVSPLISLSVTGGNKRGPDGKLHDSFSKTNFAVKVGQPTQLRIDNKDEGTHSITSPQTGVSIVVLPGIHTYTITATTAGRFEWLCIIPCDTDAKGWAMTHPGYMAGYITAT
jgi:uncharacterized cupredoxin-like copper-binding protein